MVSVYNINGIIRINNIGKGPIANITAIAIICIIVHKVAYHRELYQYRLQFTGSI